jgi:hypothetical protein
MNRRPFALARLALIVLTAWLLVVVRVGPAVSMQNPPEEARQAEDAPAEDQREGEPNAAEDDPPPENAEEAGGEMPAPQVANPAWDKEQVARSVKEILSQPEFRRLRLRRTEAQTRQEPPEMPAWLKRLLEWLVSVFKPIAEFFGFFGGLGNLGIVLAAVLIGSVVAGIVYLILRCGLSDWVSRRLGKTKTAEPLPGGGADAPPGDLPGDVYLRRAAEYAARGNFREAVGQLLLGAMSNTERSGRIRFRRGLTYRDYIRALRPYPRQCTAFQSLVKTFEPLRFGRRVATANHYTNSLQSYEDGFTTLAS